MSALRQWLLGVTACALAVSLAQALTPEGAVKKVGRLIGALLLLLSALRPLLTLDPEAVAQAAALTYGQDLPEADGGQAVLRELIAEKCGAYIADKGSELGLVCSVTVTVAEGEGGWSIPWSAQVTGTFSEEGRRALSRLMEEELDIPAERQTFLEGGP